MRLTHRNGRMMGKVLVAILLVIGFIFPQVEKSVNAAEKYSDVTRDNDHYQNILDAGDLGFMGGYPDGTFKPHMKMPRANVVKALGKYVIQMSGKSLSEYDVSDVAPFNDIPATYPDKELYNYSLVVKKEGVFTGSNNNLLPRNLITRQQMAKVLVNAFDLRHVEGAKSLVTDHHLATPEFREYIDILSENFVTSVTNYRPTESTTRGQFATFLVRSYGASLENEIPTEPDKPEEPEVPEEPELPEEPEPAPATPLFVEELLPMKGQYFVLPQTVKVTYSDGTEKSHAVTWDDSHVTWDIVGTYELIGEVEDTNLKARLTVEKIYLPIYYPDLIMILPGPEVTKASNLIGKLAEEVKNADNAVHATEKWRTANNAVIDVRIKFPKYDLSAWQTILDREWTVIEKRQSDINKARTDAQVAISKLLGAHISSSSKVVEEQQEEITKAKNIVAAYEKLDKRANTTNLHTSIAKHEQRVNDLGVAIGYLNQMTLRLEDPSAEFVKAYRVSPKITDSSVHVIWRHMYETDVKVRNYNDYWSIERRYVVSPFANLYADFSVQVLKGDAVVSRDLRVHVPEGNLIYANPRAHFENINRPSYRLKLHQSN